MALDLRDEDSMELLQVIDQRFPDAPAILMTSDNTDNCDLIERIEITRKQGTWQLIEKPFNLDILRVLIERSLCECERRKLAGHECEQGASEKRNYLRSSHVQTVQLLIDAAEQSYRAETMVKATLTDISDGGLGLITKYPLRKSQPVRFVNTDFSNAGVVAWTAETDNHICRAGVQFC